MGYGSGAARAAVLALHLGTLRCSRFAAPRAHGAERYRARPGDPLLPLDTIVIVGGSLAGIRCAEALRRRGFAGRLGFVSEERERPYDRPPLSKELLRGDREPDQIRLNKPDAFDALALDLRLGARAQSLDPTARRVTLANGEVIAYDGLVIATGAIARPLPGAPALAGLFTLRTLDDALALRADLERAPRVVVVGAGFIGAEAASG